MLNLLNSKPKNHSSMHYTIIYTIYFVYFYESEDPQSYK